MTATNIRKGESFIWLPPRSVGERAFASEARMVALLLGPDGPGYQRLSLDALPQLGSVTLLFDARDVALLRAKVPPISGAKLRAALPNLVEDQLLQDAGSCAFALGPQVGPEGERMVAVVDRSWLEFVLGAFERRGAKVQAAWPAQLALPMTGKGNWSLLCLPDGLALRTDAVAGMGWPASDDALGRTEALTSMLASAGECAGKKVVVFSLDDGWQQPVEDALEDLDLTLDGRMHRMPAPQPAPVDLLAGRVRRGALGWISDVNWRAWRWPAALAGAAVAAWLLGLNIHWAQLAQERNELRAALETTFRRTFPDAKVVVDPVLQMEREVATLRTRSGQSGPADFVPMLARLGQALGAQSLDALTTVDYRDGGLRVKFKPAVVQTRAARDKLLEACRRVGLRLEFDQPRDSSLGAAVTVM